jgi:hypothetical protein
MMVPIDIPTAGDLRQIREWLRLSQAELGTVLGFGPKAERVVRRWETDSTFRPTPLAWAAIRFLVIVVDLYRAMAAGPAKDKLSALLPEVVR